MGLIFSRTNGCTVSDLLWGTRFHLILQAEDMVTLGLNATALAALLADPSTDPAKHAEYAAVEAMRLDELALISTGDAACASVHPAPWPDCASLGDAKLNDTDTDNGTVYTATLEQCSYDCTADSQVRIHI